MTVKIKYHGQKIAVRKMRPNERIDNRTLFSQYLADYPEEDFQQIPWTPSLQIGDLVKDYASRTYAKVISDWAII